MSFAVVFRRTAKREFDDAISWYQDRREGLRREFSVAVEQQLGRLRFRQTSSRALEVMCAEQDCGVFHTPYISSLKTIGL